MSHLFLSHLSQNNNCPNLVGELFNKHARGVKMIVTSRFQETPIFHISNTGVAPFDISHHAIPVRQLSFSFA
jgi:hypothetical protein